MKQFEASKKEYIAKLKRELDTVEERFHKQVHQSRMIGEDHRSQAVLSYRRLLKTQMALEESEANLEAANKALEEKSKQLGEMIKYIEDNKMETEDHVCQIFYKNEQINKMRDEAEEQAG